MASFRQWLHHEAAKKGWEEIYSHLEDYVQQPKADDTASAVTATKPSTQGGGLHCKCECECDEEDEDSHTVIRYMDLTITVYGKIKIGDNLVSLSIYEHLCLVDIEKSIFRARTMQQRDGHLINQFGLPSTSEAVPFIPLDFSRNGIDRILIISGKRAHQKVHILNGKNESYLMVRKNKQDNGTPYSVFVAPRKGKIKAMSTFIVNLRHHPTVLYLNDNPDYALKYDPDKQKVIVDRYVSDDQRFKFDLDRIGPGCKCDCNSSV